jgi:hypothetical protein
VAEDSANESRSLAAINESVHWVYTDGAVLLTSPLTTTARATYDDPRHLSTGAVLAPCNAGAVARGRLTAAFPWYATRERP